MTRTFSGSRHYFLRTTLVLLFSTVVHGARAQVSVPSFRSAPRIYFYATFTDIKPNYQYHTDLAVYGATLGGYIQTRRIVGLEIRGSAARWGGGQHEEALLGGPRAALHFGRLSPYVAFLGGGGNAWSRERPASPGLPTPPLRESTGLQWTILGGVDIYLRHRFSLRAGEVSYSQLYATNKTITPLGASAGIVYRFR